MTQPGSSDRLSRRERQVVEIILRKGQATAREIEQELPDAPSYSAVRSILRILTHRKLILKEFENGRDTYRPVVPAKIARTSALQNLVGKLFENSVGEAACALLGQKNIQLSESEAERLIRLIEEARKK